MSYLTFISDENLIRFTKEVLDKTGTAEKVAETEMHSNVIDPFSAMFDSMRQGIKLEAWYQQERARQVQKTLQNALGDFHQNILGSMHGWHNAGKGGSYDVINEEKMIIAELKNKHNTLNSGSAEATYSKLAGHIRYAERGYVAYLVFIIPKNTKPFNVAWSPNLATTMQREDIRKIDGKSFYDLASGCENALYQLYAALPNVINDITNSSADLVFESDLFEELYLKAYSK